MIRSMIRAGNSTTSAAIVNTVAALERHPEQKAKYLADIDGLTPPTLLEEGLRYDGPALGLWRRCSRATSIQGYELNPGGTGSSPSTPRGGTTTRRRSTARKSSSSTGTGSSCRRTWPSASASTTASA